MGAINVSDESLNESLTEIISSLSRDLKFIQLEEENSALKQELQALRDQKPVLQLGSPTLFWLCDNDKKPPVGTRFYAAPIPAREGWQLVPIILTAEMLKAAQRAEMDHSEHDEWLYDDIGTCQRRHKAMLDAVKGD